MKYLFAVLVVMLSVTIVAGHKPPSRPPPPHCPGGECPDKEGVKQCGHKANGEEVLMECKSGCWTIL